MTTSTDDPPKRWLNRTVAGAGITSSLGDFCYETTTVILPGFLAVLGIPAAVLGLIEGIADAIAACGLPASVRGEALTLTEFAALTDALAERK